MRLAIFWVTSNRNVSRYLDNVCNKPIELFRIRRVVQKEALKHEITQRERVRRFAIREIQTYVEKLRNESNHLQRSVYSSSFQINSLE